MLIMMNHHHSFSQQCPQDWWVTYDKWRGQKGGTEENVSLVSERGPVKMTPETFIRTLCDDPLSGNSRIVQKERKKKYFPSYYKTKCQFQDVLLFSFSFLVIF
jgi:hypothetical protein